jgi:ribosomal protein S19
MMTKIKKRFEFVLQKDIGGIFEVHNGRAMIKVKPTVVMAGHRYGEFVLTRKKFKANKKNKR